MRTPADPNDYQRTRQRQFREAGLCGRCGQNPPADGSTWCAACVEYRTRVYRRQRKLRAGDGLCQTCGINPAQPGEYCETCRNRQRTNHAETYTPSRNPVGRHAADPERTVWLVRMAAEGVPYRQIAEWFGISPGTVYNAVRRERQKQVTK
jgi:hypothetical protein